MLDLDVAAELNRTPDCFDVRDSTYPFQLPVLDTHVPPSVGHQLQRLLCKLYRVLISASHGMLEQRL